MLLFSAHIQRHSASFRGLFLPILPASVLTADSTAGCRKHTQQIRYIASASVDLSADASAMITSSDSNQGLARKATAVGVVGEMNQLFTVYEANWNCPGRSRDSSSNLNAVSRRWLRSDGLPQGAYDSLARILISLLFSVLVLLVNSRHGSSLLRAAPLCSKHTS